MSLSEGNRLQVSDFSEKDLVPETFTHLGVSFSGTAIQGDSIRWVVRKGACGLPLVLVLWWTRSTVSGSSPPAYPSGPRPEVSHLHRHPLGLPHRLAWCVHSRDDGDLARIVTSRGHDRFRAGSSVPAGNILTWRANARFWQTSQQRRVVCCGRSGTCCPDRSDP
jgi:hypothetical protein